MPYIISWSNVATSNEICDLSAGTYVYTVTDNQNYSIIDSVEIGEASFVQIDVINQDLGWVNVNDGSIELSAINGTIERVEWEHGASGTLIEGLSAGDCCASIMFSGDL